MSTKEQVDEGNSLSSQEKICREYALKQGFEIDQIFIEKGESAKTIDRTELQNLLKYCSVMKNNISGVIVHKIDRLSRSTADYHEIRILLKRYGINIFSTTEFFEDTPAGRFMENIIANVAQFDNDVRTERSMGGMRDAMREGRYVWMAPIGYINTKTGGKSTIAPNEKAPLIKRLFEEIAKNHYPMEEIRKMIFHEGLAKKEGKPLARSYFYTLLKNELYCGWIIKFGERHKGLFTPIVSEELFHQVQLVVKNRTRKSSHYLVKHPDFPLRRFVHHPTGEKLTGGWSQGKNKKYPYYRYGTLGMSFPRDAFERAYIDLLSRFQIKEEHFPTFKQKLQEFLGKGVSNRQKNADGIKSQIENLKAKQKALIDKNISGVISDILLKDQLTLIENELMELQSLLYCQPNHEVDFDELVVAAKDYLQNPGILWEKANLENKIRLQEFNFPKGIAFDGKIFTTPEICRLFKVKDIFLPELSSRVHSNKNILNNIEITNPKKDNINQGQNNYNIEPFWEEVGLELIELNEILKNNNNESG